MNKEKKYDDFGAFHHSQITIEEFYKELNNPFNDEKSKNIILSKIKELELKANSAIDFLGYGESSAVFSLNDMVIKFSEPQKYHTPLSLDDVESIPYSEYRSLRVIQKLDTTGLGDDDPDYSQYIYNKLRDFGYVWCDAKNSNLGRLPNSGNDLDSIRLLDDGFIFSESNFVSDETFLCYDYNLAHEDSVSAFDIMYMTKLGDITNEYKYQKTINPNFKLKDIKDMMKIDKKYAKEIINLLKVSTSIEKWNSKHEKDSVRIRYDSEEKKKYYIVTGESAELFGDEEFYIFPYNPMFKLSCKKLISKAKSIFNKKSVTNIESDSDNNSNNSANSSKSKIQFRDQLHVNPDELQQSPIINTITNQKSVLKDEKLK